MINFTYTSSFKKTDWNCKLDNIRNYTDYIICTFNGRGSSIEACISKNADFRWILFPDLEKGCTLSTCDDYFWNYEKLIEIFDNYIDSATVASGLTVLKGLLNQQTLYPLFEYKTFHIQLYKKWGNKSPTLIYNPKLVYPKLLWITNLLFYIN